jgi:hypothetical protein
MNEIFKARLGLIPVLAERAAAGHIGRTALMKYAYFLQTLRGVPLGYKFSMYSYGPFDSDVLADLSSAEALDIVTIDTVQFSGGYGYRIKPGSHAENAKHEINDFLAKHNEDVDWLFEMFGHMQSADLELASTIVYVDREFAEGSQLNQKANVVTRVSQIKPHFSKKQIQTVVDDLLGKGVLVSLAADR